ncbi:monovalent cation/H(+) antiporter subunit G [Catalinimonas niigatensis]|uniref:monovalent cation/H(+) antiporter subunit G n=1 Tax=Catalinimonas niigatensis TaxID=1397264 RepID=UPI002665D565|nr:monovalent cation/H(+) antiporter subunit G [Catalinimonas niigatensis]WPP52160.1 monovalent cation/H(+) antiporter subunit G [Catalinimonas niigatensis]
MLQSIIQVSSAVFILIGTGFMLVASIGILRFPDFYIRMSAITKATSLGLGFILGGAAIYFNTLEVILKAGAILFFIVLTSPISAYIIAKAASLIKVPFWEKTNLHEYEAGKDTPDGSKKSKPN